jgi:[ribosomal protein S5]-alanine N-acetyltransferase
MHLPVLPTERLLIRPLEPDDLDGCQTVLGAVGDPVDLEPRREWLRWTVASYAQLEALRQPPYGDRAIVRRSDGRLVGACGLVPCLAPFGQLDRPEPARWTSEVGLYYELGPEHRGQGYATEAVGALIRWAGESMRLARIVATTSYDNARSIAVMERLGMTVVRNLLADPPWFQVVGIHDYAS